LNPPSASLTVAFPSLNLAEHILLPFLRGLANTLTGGGSVGVFGSLIDQRESDLSMMQMMMGWLRVVTQLQLDREDLCLGVKLKNILFSFEGKPTLMPPQQ
jgi:hypothetical protein